MTDIFTRCPFCHNLFRENTDHYCPGFDGKRVSIVKHPRAAVEQDKPIITEESRDVTSAVIADIKARSDAGLEKYGSRLMTNNGRDALLDLYQELVDAVVYTKQLLMENEVREKE